MTSRARNLANFLGTGNTTVPASKLSADVPRDTENYSSFEGYISDAKFVSGNALYTSDFTPHTEPFKG